MSLLYRRSKAAGGARRAGETEKREKAKGAGETRVKGLMFLMGNDTMVDVNMDYGFCMSCIQLCSTASSPCQLT